MQNENPNYIELSAKIYTQLDRLIAIEVGQVFNSQYYGDIVATRVVRINLSSAIYSIYGFDIEKGDPRSVTYPTECKLVGKPIMLSDVLNYLIGMNTEIHSINVYGMFHDANFNGIQNNLKISWDFSKPYLIDQNETLIEYLNTLK